jgi:hypothetical protein
MRRTILSALGGEPDSRAGDPDDRKQANVGVSERVLLRAAGVGIGGFLGAVVGASVALVRSCEPDYPMLCELASVLGGVLGLTIGATLVGVAVGMALRGTLVKWLSVIAAVVIFGVGLFFLRLRVSYPQAFRYVLFQTSDLWVTVSVFLGVIVGLLALLWERRIGRAPR